MKYLTLSCLLVFLAGCGVTQDKSKSQEVAAQLAKARKHLSDGNPDAALLITDDLLEQDGKLRDARLLAGEANIALVAENRTITESFIDDAVRHYELALAIDRNDGQTLHNLSWAYYLKRDFDRGASTAIEAAKLFHGKDPESHSRAVLRAALNYMGTFKIARRAELESEDTEVQPETAAKASAVMKLLDTAKRGLPGEGYLMASQLYRWLSRPFEEINELERGIQAKTDYFPLHQRYRDLRAEREEVAQCVAFYRAYRRDHGANSAMAWSQGIAESALGDMKRRAGDRDAAERSYTSAIKSFKLCKRGNPDWTGDCNNWIAIEHLSLAKIHEQAGNIGVATGHLEKAFAITPRVAETDANSIPLIMDSFRTHYFGTLSHLGRAIASGGTKESLLDGLEFWDGFLKLHPEKHGWMYNNAAFNVRDYGTTIETEAANGTAEEKRKAAAQAMKHFERSYELYAIGARLDPDDARTVNDQGLMLIYHLKRDYPLAEKLFKQAIKVGKVKLESLDEDTPLDNRNSFEEAVGDAYQNLGKMYLDLGKTFEEYAPPLRESLKYFPKQRRESVQWLRRGTAKAPVKNVSKPQVDPRKAALDPVVEAAKNKAAAKDFDGALLVLDKVTEKMTGFAPYHFYQGFYALRYAQQSMQRGGSAGQIDGLLADARNNLQRSVQLDSEPVETRLHLAEANYESSEFENAAKISAALILHITSLGGTTDENVAATQRVRAKSGTKLYVAARQANKDNASELHATRNAFRNLEHMGALDATSRKTWASLEQWAGDKAGALDIYLRGVKKTPGDQTLLGEFVELARATQQSSRAIADLKTRVDGVTFWYLGQSYFYSSYEKPAVDTPRSIELALSKAIDSFEVSRAHNPTFDASCSYWTGICFGRKGFFALDKKLYQIAESDFLTAAEKAPARLNAAAWGDRSVKTGMQLLVHHYFTSKDLAKAVSFLQKVCMVVKNDAGFSNNLGLFARDHGKALEDSGKADEAKKMYWISYKAYKNAVRIEPDSVRQRNDLVVMLLYHVKRDLDSVTETLTACIKDGEGQLAEDPPQDKQELQDLQESVGDSYQNLGYYQMTFGKDPESARKNLEKSLAFYPFKIRRSTRLLRQLDGGK